jgi:hypothetical protein
MGGPDTTDMGPLCAAFVKARDTLQATRCVSEPPSADQAFHSCAPSILEPFLSQEVVFVGLAAQHTGPDAVLRALFGGGVKRHAKPSKELAVAAEASEGAPAVCDLVIQSQSPGGQWNEHMYLDRVTVSQGKARAWRLQQTGVSPHLPPLRHFRPFFWSCAGHPHRAPRLAQCLRWWHEQLRRERQVPAARQGLDGRGGKEAGALRLGLGEVHVPRLLASPP